MHEATKEILYPLFDSPDRPQTFRFRKRRTTFGRSVILTIDWVLNSSDWSDGISFEEKRFLMYCGCSFCVPPWTFTHTGSAEERENVANVECGEFSNSGRTANFQNLRTAVEFDRVMTRTAANFYFHTADWWATGSRKALQTSQTGSAIMFLS